MRLLGGFAASAAIVMSIAPASASAALPVGSSSGVGVTTSSSGAVVDVQSAKQFALIRDRKTAVRCTTLPAGGKLSLNSARIASKTVTAPKTRKAFRVSVRLSSPDFCAVARVASTRTVRKGGKVKRTKVSARTIAVVPVTQKGAIFLEEQARALELLSVLGSAGKVADTRTPSAYPLPAGFVRGKVGALASPAASPAAGRLGYYSDGARHATVVALSATGRRLFIDVNGGVISSNVLNYLDR